MTETWHFCKGVVFREGDLPGLSGPAEEGGRPLCPLEGRTIPRFGVPGQGCRFGPIIRPWPTPPPRRDAAAIPRASESACSPPFWPAVLAVALAIVSIGEHRAHTAAILHLSLANRQWARYEVATLKYINRESGGDPITGLNGNQPAAKEMRTDYARQKKKYEQQANEIHERAEHITSLAESDERRALRYDVGDGFLEIAVFLATFYFLSRKNLFALMGAAIGICRRPGDAHRSANLTRCPVPIPNYHEASTTQVDKVCDYTGG